LTGEGHDVVPYSDGGQNNEEDQERILDQILAAVVLCQASNTGRETCHNYLLRLEIPRESVDDAPNATDSKTQAGECTYRN